VKKDTGSQLLPNIPSYSLRLFLQIDSTQKLLRSDLIQDGEVRLVFRFPTKKPEFKPLNFTPGENWAMEEFTPKKDTVFLWLTKVSTDSLILQVTNTGSKTDTAIIDLKTLGKKKNTGKKQKPETLKLFPNTPGNRLNQFISDLEITFSYPVSHADFSKMLLITGKDTSKPKVSFADSIRKKIKVKEKWKEDKNYKLIIPDSVFFGINNLANDSVICEFRTKALKDFGTFKVGITMNQKPGNYIIQLLDEKERVLEERKTNKPCSILFDYLSPGKYKLKAILDRNNNGQWDAGVYLKHIQPEEVFYFPKTIEVRGNWDIDETWPL
jgi:hypothetical protein